MQVIFLLIALINLCSSFPTGPPRTFVLDLTGGGGQPGQVIGHAGFPVEPNPTVTVGPLIVAQDPLPLDPVPNPVVQTFPDVVVRDPLPSSVTVGPLIVPHDPFPANPLPSSVTVGPLIVPHDPFPANRLLTDPVSNPILVETLPGIVPRDPLPSAVTVGPLIVPHGPLPANPVPVPQSILSSGAGVNTPNAIDWTCDGYRAHHSNRNMYQVFFNNQWSDYSCFGILVWNQTLCSCLVPEATGYVDTNCPNNKAHPTDPTLYHIKHWGVWIKEPKSCPPHQLWNQTGCRCDWDPVGPGGVFDAPLGGICDLMFNASFTTGLLDDANYNSIGRDPWFNVKTENGTARLDNGRMPVWAFASNDFGRDMQVQLDFQLDNIPASANRYTTLFSNNCEYDRPSVEVGYRPSDQRYRVFFRDTYLNGTEECLAPTLTPYAFQSISLEYQSSRLSLKVNGAVCVESNRFGGDVAISQCPFYFGGDGRRQYMSGNMDNVIVRRFCVNPV